MRFRFTINEWHGVFILIIAALVLPSLCSDNVKASSVEVIEVVKVLDTQYPYKMGNFNRVASYSKHIVAIKVSTHSHYLVDMRLGVCFYESMAPTGNGISVVALDTGTCEKLLRELGK